MSIVKSSYGVSTEIYRGIDAPEMHGMLSGSSIDRKKPDSTIKIKRGEKLERIIYHKLSPRSKSKIRKKLMAFSRVTKNMTFLTLTFVNEISDVLAIKVLHEFLENVRKANRLFQYLWVAERQMNNVVFKGNIHFHLVSNKFWEIEKWWSYWLDLQAKHGIIPRCETSRPTSAFDVKHIKTENLASVVKYLTKYVTKNNGRFVCQPWHCSRGVSKLYTDMYTGPEIINDFERLEKANLLDGTIKIFEGQHWTVRLVPINKLTMNFYKRIDDKNKEVWSTAMHTAL